MSNVDPKDHMSNERTFLAWIRTSIGIIAFGFVIEKSSLVKELIVLEGGKPANILPSSLLADVSTFFGAFLITCGAMIACIAFFQFKKVTKELEEIAYRPSIVLSMILTLVIVIIGLFLIL